MKVVIYLLGLLFLMVFGASFAEPSDAEEPFFVSPQLPEGNPSSEGPVHLFMSADDTIDSVLKITSGGKSALMELKHGDPGRILQLNGQELVRLEPRPSVPAEFLVTILQPGKYTIAWCASGRACVEKEIIVGRAVVKVDDETKPAENGIYAIDVWLDHVYGGLQTAELQGVVLRIAGKEFPLTALDCQRSLCSAVIRLTEGELQGLAAERKGVSIALRLQTGEIEYADATTFFLPNERQD